MKVLWFTNVELPAVTRRRGARSEEGGGWLESLRAALCIQGSVELAAAAAGVERFDPFDDGGVRYYHMDAPPSPRGVAGVVAHWKHHADDAPLLAQAAAVVEDFGPDLIHVHGSERPFGLLAEGMAAPVLVSLQGILLACSRAYLSGIPRADVLRDVASTEFAKGRGLVHAKWAMRAAARRELTILRDCRYFAGRTEWDKDTLLALNPDARYYHLDEVLRPEFYVSTWEPSVEGPFVVVMSAGPAPYKGLIRLLEAVSLLRRAGQRDIRVRVAGGVRESEIWSVVERSLHRLRLGGTVDLLGHLSAADVVSELRGASVYVHPSFVDNSPNALAEAMILGVPCVASSVDGIPSMLEDGREGLLCPPGDVAGLAARIGAIAEDPALASRLGENARRRALQRHEPGAIVHATLEAYADIVSRACAGVS